MNISQTLCQVGRTKSIVPVSYVYIPGPMSGGKVPEYSTRVLSIYPRPFVGWEGTQSIVLRNDLCIYPRQYVRWNRSMSIVLAYCIYHRPSISGKVPEYSTRFHMYIYSGPMSKWQGRQCLGPHGQCRTKT